MSTQQTIVIPELGDFDAVPIIEVLVSVGDRVDKETPLITLESDKATMDVPSSHAGIVSKILVSAGQEVGQGDAIIELTLVDAQAGSAATESAADIPAPAEA